MKKKLSICETILSFIATTMSSGILAIPYAIVSVGLVNGIVINFMVMTVVMFGSYLYIRALHMLKLQSISELCFISFGPCSIYIINGLFALIIFGFIILF